MSNAGDLFGAVATEYDQQRRLVIPCYTDFYGSILRAFPFPDQDQIKVLDLGAGTGLVSAMVAEAYPHSRVLAVDISEKMLDQARKRFAQNTRVSVKVMDYGEQPLPMGFDAVVSALSIHHLDHQGKRELFSKIHDALNPGGVFVNAELVLGESQEVEDLWQRVWREYLEGGGLGRDELDAIYHRMEIDINAGLWEQMDWLRDAGFSDVDCLYKYNNFAVYMGGRR